MTTSEPSMTEPELRVLLRENDGSIELSSDRREVLRRRIRDLDHSAPTTDRSAVAGAPVVETFPQVNVEFDALKQTASARRRWPLVAAAILVIGAIALLQQRGDSPNDLVAISDTKNEAQPNTDPSAAQSVSAPVASSTGRWGITFCSARYGPLVEAVGIWDGVDNWVFLTDRRQPEPDLATLALSALESVSESSLDSANEASLSDLIMILRQLREGTAPAEPDAGSFGLSSAERTAHRDAVNGALVYLAAFVDEQGLGVYAGCAA